MKLSISQLLSMAIAISLINVVAQPSAALAHHKSVSTKHPKTVNRQVIRYQSSKIKPHKSKSIGRSRVNSSGTYLRLVYKYRGRANQLGNPVYTLEAYANGQKYRSFKAVTGTAYTQNRDRDRANVAAPLPDGLYKVSPQIVAGNVPEVGRTFVPIYPQFPTARSGLGIHLDPSFNRSNGNDGTAGCIGLIARADRDAFDRYILQYQPRNLVVKIML
jgi:predicted component of type VI protein secretion system